MAGSAYRVNIGRVLLLIILMGIILFFIGKYAINTLARPAANDKTDIPKNVNNTSVTQEAVGTDPVTETGIKESTNINKDNNTKSDDNDKPSKGTDTNDDQGHLMMVKDPSDLLVLVNKTYNLPEDYVPKDMVLLSVYAPGKPDNLKYLRREAADALYDLLDAIEADGLDLVPSSTYRSYQLQKIIFENNVKLKGSVEKANRTSAKPGQSEHQTGLAVDLSCKEIDYKVNNDFADTDQAKWINENAYKYGFIVRYPKGKEAITGYSFEPWHIRYVGKDAAQYIYENGITYEEYNEQYLKSGDNN